MDKDRGFIAKPNLPHHKRPLHKKKNQGKWRLFQNKNVILQSVNKTTTLMDDYHAETFIITRED